MTFMRKAFAPVAFAATLLPLAPAHADEQRGRASWYAFTTITASGERANPGAMTAAHRTLPFGTRVQVQNLDNGRSVVVRINDRGPFVRGRIIDVTRAAASQLGFINAGTARVQISVVSQRRDGGHGQVARGTRPQQHLHRRRRLKLFQQKCEHFCARKMRKNKQIERFE